MQGEGKNVTKVYIISAESLKILEIYVKMRTKCKNKGDIRWKLDF